jgi:SM-20-related protein
MITPEAAAQFNLYLVKGFFDVPMCEEIIAELVRSPVAPATTYGRSESGYIDETVRRTTRVKPSTETVELVKRQLSDRRQEIAAHFGIDLSNVEDPQFLRYRVGDFFVAHQDGNTGLLRLDREQSRKVSVIIFLNRQSETQEAGAYGGGSLVISEWRPGRTSGELRLSAETGTLLAFPSDTTHEVIPVTRGERYSIVSWYG